MKNVWLSIDVKLPEEGVEVIGYSKKWVDPDFNPRGTRICFLNSVGDWYSAKWHDEQDHWHTHAAWSCAEHGGKDFEPTHWIDIPTFPTKRKKE